MDLLLASFLQEIPDWLVAVIMSIGGVIASLVVYRVLGGLDKRYVKRDDYSRDLERNSLGIQELRTDTERKLVKIESGFIDRVEDLEKQILDVRTQSENQHKELKNQLHDIRQDMNVNNINLVQRVGEMRGEMKVILDAFSRLT